MLDFEDDNVVHMPTNVQTTSPEAAKTLEQAWQRRRAELADWTPSAAGSRIDVTCDISLVPVRVEDRTSTHRRNDERLIRALWPKPSKPPSK